MIDQLDIQLDDLPPDFREIAQAIGLEPALKLTKLRPGEGVYIPTPEKICRAARNRAMRAAFESMTGTPTSERYRALARQHGMSVKWVRHIVHGKDGPATDECVDRQFKLF